ncbi:hypothetical protein K8I61_08975 [bacterium]|nr:hypothetical protein [bacterium]
MTTIDTPSTSAAANERPPIVGMPAVTGERRRDLDFYRGFTVVQMVAAHLLMHSVAPMRADETMRLFLFSYAELFSAGFLMLAGINVDLVMDRMSANPAFRITKFYALTAWGLFFMGWSYNLLEGTGPWMSVVQSIGVGVFVTYIFLRVKTPTWLLPIVALLFLACYYLAVGANLSIAPDVRDHFFWRLFAGHGEMTKEGLKALWPTPYLFAMFGGLPVSGFVLMGVFIERMRGARAVAWGAFCLALAFASHLMPTMIYNPDTHPVLRADLKFLMQILPLYTGWLFTFRYLYPKVRRTKFTRAIEFFGVNSLDFLVFHWIFIGLVTVTTPFLNKTMSFAAAQWVRAGLVVVLLALTLPRFDALRRRIAARPEFLRRAWRVLLACFAIAILSAGARIIGVRMIAGLVAALTFCLMYPAQRAAWRAKCTKAALRR